MSDLARVLRLRPANVIGRMGDTSTLPVLSPSRLDRALATKDVPLLCLPVVCHAALPGILHAARELDAVLGLSCPVVLDDLDATERFTGAVHAAGEGIHRKPMFLEAGPLRIASVDGAMLDVAYTVVSRLLEAGFSLISLDASGLSVANNVHVCRDIVRAADGKPLEIEVTAPRSATGKTTPDGLRHYLKSLSREGVTPRFVRVEIRPSAEGANGAAEMDISLLGELQVIASGAQVSLTVTAPTNAGPSHIAEIARAGARKIDVEGTISRVVLSMLPEDMRAGLEARAAEVRLSPVQVLGPSDGEVLDADPRLKDRVEALAFADVIGLLQAIRASGTGSSAMNWLVDHGRD